MRLSGGPIDSEPAMVRGLRVRADQHGFPVLHHAGVIDQLDALDVGSGRARYQVDAAVRYGNDPHCRVYPPARSMVRWRSQSGISNLPGRLFQTPTFELAAKPACGSAATIVREKKRGLLSSIRDESRNLHGWALRAPCSDGRVHRLTRNLASTRWQGRETARSGR